MAASGIAERQCGQSFVAGAASAFLRLAAAGLFAPEIAASNSSFVNERRSAHSPINERLGCDAPRLFRIWIVSFRI